MALEIEKKYRVSLEEKERVKADLKDQDAIFVQEDFEVNMLYGGGILEEKKALLRVRKTADKTTLTYKQKVGNLSGIKQHVELETEVVDAEALESIIANLGFAMGMVYEKRRETWKFKDVEIVFDELPFGSFMEIEGRITDIAMAEMLLDMEEFEVEPLTYPQLTEKLGIEKDGMIEARFMTEE